MDGDRGRPEKLSRTLKLLIAGMKEQNPKKTVKQIQIDVKLYLIDKVKKAEYKNDPILEGIVRRIEAFKNDRPELSDKEIDKRIEKEIDAEALPGESAINKFLTPTNQKLRTADPLDREWTIGSLQEHELVKEVVPILLLEQNKRLNNKPFPSPIITIKQAIWVSRLYSTILKLLENKDWNVISESLLYWAGEYTIAEKLSTAAGISPLETKELDADLVIHADMSRVTWLKNAKDGNSLLEVAIYPPSHFGSPFQYHPNYNFKRIAKKNSKEAGENK